MPLLRRHWYTAIVAVATALGPAVAPFAQTILPEAQIKAAFVLNFARYVEWPDRAFASRDAPLLICVVGRDTFGTALGALENRQVHGRPVNVRSGLTVEESRGCHVVFVSDSEARRLTSLLRSLAGRPILTVSDAEGFIDSGGAIGIVPGDDRLQFEINRSVLEQAHLKASSQLLRLARTVLNPGN